MNGHDEKQGREGGGRDAGERQSAAQRAVDGYRSANAALDERPSAQVRAAILAAAAREVGAQPRDAAASAPPPRARQPRGALRWPMAAAATVLLSSVAVMMASRVEEAQHAAESAPPSVAASVEPPAPPVATPAASPVTAPVAPPLAIPAPPAAQSAAQPAVPPLSAQSAAQPATQAAPQSAAPAPFADAPRERSVVPPQRAPSAAPPPPAAPSAESAAPSIATGAAGNLSRDLGTLHQPEAQIQQRARNEAKAGAGSAALDTAEEAALSADDWLARIVRLREAGRHAEADAQLQRFRQRHPQVKVPEAALAPTGTR